MFDRFKRETGDRPGTGVTRSGNGNTAVAERPVDESTAGEAPALRRSAARETLETARARQRDEYGGVNWGAAFFGWLVAVGLGALLVGILAAAGAAVGLTELSSTDARQNAETIGLGGGIALLVVLLIAYYCGGYVAGRMSRFDGARQGFGVWAFAVLVTIVLAVAAVVLGDQYNVLSQLNLPALPVGESTLTTGGAIALAAIVIGTLLAAGVGGKAGERYHRKVDRVGFAD